MNMVTYADPPTPVEIARARMRRRLVLGAIGCLLLVLRATRSEEAGSSPTTRPDQL